VTKHENVRAHELKVHHADGRGVTCSILGARDFKNTIFYSHGFPASRIEAAVAHREALGVGLTIVALDRPGFGGSDWYPGRRFEDWAGDVALVADHLGVARFGILGVSGGTPTAVAAAALLRERVTMLSVVSGMAPINGAEALAQMNGANRMLLQIGRRCPSIGRFSIRIIAEIWRLFPMAASVWFGLLLPQVDKEIVTRRDIGLVLAKNIRESLRQGVAGAVTEFELLISDWQGLLEQVQVPTTIWHGDADTYVPVSMATILQKGIRGSIFHEVKGGGHFMIIDRLPAILKTFDQI
jgi:pimeloyl-ACP methyl ester carboxylesterase